VAESIELRKLPPVPPASPVWCQKRIHGNDREIVDMMKVEATLYEQNQAAYKTGRDA